MPTPAKSTGQILSELWELLQSYAKQQTIDPLKALGRYLGYGVGGALCFGLGLFFVALAGLRALQSEMDWFRDTSWWVFEDLTFLPYVIVMVALGVVAGVVGLRMNRAIQKERR